MNLIAQLPPNPSHVSEFFLLRDVHAPLQRLPAYAKLSAPHRLAEFLAPSYQAPIILTHLIQLPGTHPAACLEPRGCDLSDYAERSGFCCALPEAAAGFAQHLANALVLLPADPSFLFWQFRIDLRGAPLRDRVKAALRALCAQSAAESARLSAQATSNSQALWSVLESCGYKAEPAE